MCVALSAKQRVSPPNEIFVCSMFLNKSKKKKIKIVNIKFNSLFYRNALIIKYFFKTKFIQNERKTHWKTKLQSILKQTPKHAENSNTPLITN